MTSAHQIPMKPRGPGRPREFDVDEAVDKAIRVFSERGYHATSISDLTEAMELAQGSIYKAFKDKRAVFLAALDRYRQVRRDKLERAVETGETGLARVRQVLTYYLDTSHGAKGRQGCLVVGAAVELAIDDKDIAGRVGVAFKQIEDFVARQIREGQQDGSIPAHVDVDAAARLMLCLVQGMRVVGKTGRQRRDMIAVVDMALRALA